MSLEIASVPFKTLSNGKKAPLKTIGLRQSNVNIASFPIQGSLSGIFQQSKYVDFSIRESDVDFVDSFLLKMRVGNTNASSCTLIQAPLLLERIELYVGSNQVMDVYQDHLWYGTYSCLNDEETILHAQQQNWSSGNYVASQQIPASGSVQWLINIPTIIDKARMPLCVLDDKYFRLRFHFLAGDTIFANGSSHTTVSDVLCEDLELFAVGSQLSASARVELKKQFEQDHHYHLSIPERQIINVGPLSSGASISETLTSFKGRYTRLGFFIRAANASGQELVQQDGNNYTLDELTVLKSGGSPLYVQQLPGEMLRLQLPLLHGYNSKFQANSDFRFYVADFADSVKSIEGHQGALATGSAVMAGDWRIQAKATTTGGQNCDLVILGQRYMKFTLANGRAQWQRL